MLIVNPNARITKIYNSNRYNISIPKVTSKLWDVGKDSVELLRKINQGKYNTYKELEKEIPQFVIHDFLNKQIIVESEVGYYNKNILNESNYEYPLTSLVIELTNICNLNCIHCYGKFGMPKNKKCISLDDVINLKEELDKLHTMEIRLSGGECFLNTDFEDIAIYFLENGFRVGIYTNGFETERIKKFLMRTQEYHFYMAISLDGEEKYHNMVRGNNKAFINTIATMKELKKYNNVEVMIETAISKVNLQNIKAIEKMIKLEFPDFEHRMFLISPIKDCNVSFDYKDIPQMRKNCKSIFDEYYSKMLDRFKFYSKSLRCQGGVINGVLTSEGKVKCCPIAEDEIFIMGDIKERALSCIWEKPAGEAEWFRKEFIKSSKQCKSCAHKYRCGKRNCRVEAKTLTGDWKNANPYTCMIVKGYYKGDTK